MGQGGPAELEAATRADWDKMSPFENGGYLYKGMYSRNVLGSHAFGACVGSAHVACLYYALFADPVQRTAEEYHWCAHPTRSNLHLGWVRLANPNPDASVERRAGVRRGLSHTDADAGCGCRCMARSGGLLAADGNLTGAVHARCTGRRGWAYMQNLTLVEWAQVCRAVLCYSRHWLGVLPSPSGPV